MQRCNVVKVDIIGYVYSKAEVPISALMLVR